MGGESFFAHLSVKGFKVKNLIFCCFIVNLGCFFRIKGKETII